MAKLNISESEAVQMYADDHGITKNEEQEALTEYAKKNAPKSPATRKKSTTKREPKPDVKKEQVITNIADYIKTIDNISDVTITNKSKLISFKMDNEAYEINLIRKRTPKK